MAKNSEDGGRNWTDTLFMPKTDFPMRAGLPKLEPRLLERWQKIGLYDKLRAQGDGREKMVLHDGPPYANGNIHIGHALNKILKDLVVKSQQMLGRDSNYVPGWDCHGLPIEWKIEEQYRAKGKEKPAFDNAQEINAFREECRAFAAKWVDVQREEFKRLGVVGDWDNPYLTMAYPAEATIARELMQFAKSGLLYRGSKPVMWSVVEKTALAEAEVEYHDHQSDQVWVKFPVRMVVRSEKKIVKGQSAWNRLGALDKVDGDLQPASVVIWTTTPWTIPGNRAICFSSKISYGLFEVTDAPDDNWLKKGEQLILANKLADSVFEASRVKAKKVKEIEPDELDSGQCAHPLADVGYDFPIPLLDGDHVTDDTGTGFVHTAPGHGTDDYIIWMSNQAALNKRGIDTSIPFTVDGDGVYTDQAPGFAGKRVLKENGSKGDANDAVIKALADAGNIIARSRLKHSYPHSWRSKKPVIFRNTPQWFIAMDKPPHKDANHSLREIALSEIGKTQWVPESGENRINGMIENRPDWVVSRQRAWGVPISVFRNPETDQVIPGPDFDKSDELIARIEKAFHAEGADVWFRDGAKETFLKGLVDNPDDWDQVRDVLDVWFDSGCTHAFTLEDGDAFPGLQGIKRADEGGSDRVMYLEGSDQHRGWFHSSLLESCGTRGKAPYDVVVTHGFVLDPKGHKMSKSLGNVVSPHDEIKKSGADILRLWVASSDYSDDLRIGKDILKTFSETYRKLRNTIRWMLGALGHFDDTQRVDFKELPELERLMLHELTRVDTEVRAAYDTYDFRKVVAALAPFLNTDLSAFYFDIRKDTLYCEAYSSPKRHATLTVIDEIYSAVTRWLAPILSFTAEEAWLARNPDNNGSVHLEPFPTISEDWRDDALAEKWETIRTVRRVVTGALEIERAEKRIGSSLEAAPEIYIADQNVFAIIDGLDKQDFADICITSNIKVINAAPSSGAFALPDVEGVGVVPTRAEGKKCARSWRITSDVGSDPRYPDLSARDAAAVAEFDAKNGDTGGDA